MSKAIAPFVAICALCCVQSAAAETYSWGKPGSSRQDFENGSRGCALASARRDVAGDGSAKQYLRGFEVLERENNMPPMPPPPNEDYNLVRAERQVLLRRAYRPDRHVDALQAQLQQEVDRCLVRAGYIRFLLSQEQERTLKRYRPGSEQRRSYLYALGRDGHIVEAQKAPAQ